jgi:hypothetical protein
MLLHTPLLVTLRHCIVTEGFQDENWEVLIIMMSLVRVGFSSKLQVCFNCSLVPNVATNMADLINMKQMCLCHLKGG